jgi:hypothetical protein
MMTNVEMIEDSALENVVGGLSFNLGLDTKTGLTASGPLGSISIPSPLTLAKDLFTGVTSKLGDFLTKFGGDLKDLGHLFDFS